MQKHACVFLYPRRTSQASKRNDKGAEWCRNALARFDIRGEQVKPRRGMTTLWILRAFALRMTGLKGRSPTSNLFRSKKPDKRAEQGQDPRLRDFALRMTQRRIARISLHPKKPDKRAEQGHNHNLETKINFRQDWIATSFNEQWAKPISRTKVRSFSSRRPRRRTK